MPPLQYRRNEQVNLDENTSTMILSILDFLSTKREIMQHQYNSIAVKMMICMVIRLKQHAVIEFLTDKRGFTYRYSSKNDSRLWQHVDVSTVRRWIRKAIE